MSFSAGKVIEGVLVTVLGGLALQFLSQEGRTEQLVRDSRSAVGDLSPHWDTGLYITAGVLAVAWVLGIVIKRSDGYEPMFLELGLPSLQATVLGAATTASLFGAAITACASGQTVGLALFVLAVWMVLRFLASVGGKLAAIVR